MPRGLVRNVASNEEIRFRKRINVVVFWGEEPSSNRLTITMRKIKQRVQVVVRSINEDEGIEKASVLT